MKQLDSLQKMMFFSGLALVTGGVAVFGLIQMRPVRRPDFAAAMARADNYLLRQNYAGAFKVYDRLARYYPHSGELFLNRGLAHFRTANFTRALADFGRAAQDKKAAALAFQWSATIYSLKRDYAAQLAAAESAIAAGADTHDAYALRGLARAGLGKPKEALADIDAALSRNSEDAFLLLRKAEIEYGLSNFKAARRDVSSAIEWGPGYPDAYALLGRLELKAGAADKAAAAFENALRISNGEAKYARLLASVKPGAKQKQNGTGGKAASAKSGKSVKSAKPAKTGSAAKPGTAGRRK
ncbi:MAG: tetratricopeptide repeat protein [Elusimicrobiaceae bacterium]|nr:tetratricopeptide repeat protein [Elusimicrobiaceae bacterium]